MIHVTCRLTAKNLDQLWNPTHNKNHIHDLVITSSDTTCSGCFFHPLVSIQPLSCLHQTIYKPSTTPSSNTLLFPASTLHRRWFFSDRPEILSAHNRYSKIIWTSPVHLQNHSIFSAWQTRSRRHQSPGASLPSNPWFSTTLHAFRSTLRHAENIWKRTHSAADCLPASLSATSTKEDSLVSSASNNPRRFWQTVIKLPHCKSSSLLPTTSFLFCKSFPP